MPKGKASNGPAVKVVPSKKQKVRKQRKQRKNGQGKGKIGAVDQILSTQLATTQVKNIPIRCDFLPKQLRWAIIGVASYLASKGVIDNEDVAGMPNPYDQIYPGLSYLLQGMLTMIQGGVRLIDALPKFANDLVAALAPKSVKYHEFANLMFSWNTFDATAFDLGPQQVGDGTWNCTRLDPDFGAYNQAAPIVSAVASAEAYSSMLKVLGAINYQPALKIIDTGTVSVLDRDVSGFARVYRYNGLTPFGPDIGGGYYKDGELETNIFAPQLCNYCAYNVPDERAPQKLSTCSGDAQSNLGLMFTAFDAIFNKIPPSYKMIDFEEIYTMLCLWMCKLKESIQLNIAAVNPEVIQPLPFSQQDFRIMLRNALLTIFDTQSFVQAMGPTQYDPNSNAFIPFMVMPHCYGANPFNQLKIPVILKENLNALKARCLKVNKKTSHVNRPIFVPVLGRYWGDTPFTPLYNLKGVATPLFTTPSPAQDIIGLTDCYDTNTTSYVNTVGGYYQGVLGDWNEHVEQLSQVSVQTTPLTGDSGPMGLGILYFTRVEDLVNEELKKMQLVRNNRYVKSLRHAENTALRPKIEKSASKKNIKGAEVKAIPDASITELCVTVETCIRFLYQEELGLFDTIITPVVRLNPTEDALALQMYQIEVGEGLSTPNGLISTIGAGVWSKMNTYAGLCVTGTGKDTNAEYTSIMDNLVKLGKAGFLAGLLGGVAKAVFPGNDGLIDTISSIVPI